MDVKAQPFWESYQLFTESSGISPQVLHLGVVFLLDFCNLVFNKTLMLFLHERKIHLHYVSDWLVLSSSFQTTIDVSESNLSL